MEGIHYVTDAHNRRIAVQIDLQKYGELWEDIEGMLVAELRKNEESIPWEEVKEELKQEGKL